MRAILTFLMIFITATAFSQATGTNQSDSIYKANNVKVRKLCHGKDHKLLSTDFYDRDGRLIMHKEEPVYAAQKTTYYVYDSKGLLINIVDTTRNGKLSKQEEKELKALAKIMGVKGKKKKDVPPVEIENYKIEYENDQISKITKYNVDNTLVYVVFYKDNGLKQIRETYRDGQVNSSDTSFFLTKNLLQKISGWSIFFGTKSQSNIRYDLVFQNGQLLQYTNFTDNKEKETVKFIYDQNGLLVRNQGYDDSHFEYEYY
jgi:hypothetical protein